jgi:hypothetical protein
MGDRVWVDDMAELRFRAERGAILCLNDHVCHTNQLDVWIECGGVELARYTPAPGDAYKNEEWLRRTMDRHALDVATQLVRKLLNDG